MSIPWIRWYEKYTNIPMGEISIPHLMECGGLDMDAPRLEVMDRTIPIIWPWDMLFWRDNIDKLGDWISDKAEKAPMKCLDSWLSM